MEETDGAFGEIPPGKRPGRPRYKKFSPPVTRARRGLVTLSGRGRRKGVERGITWEDRVRGAYASLRPSEQKVAAYLLAHAGEVEGLTIGSWPGGRG